jgi:hypothetical protein
MGATHFRLRTLEKVGAEMSLHVLAYNLKRMSGRTLNPVITIGEGDETMKRSDMGHCPVPSWIQNGISRDRGYRPAPDIPLHRGSRKPRKRHRGV